jgi:hypothetical protein
MSNGRDDLGRSVTEAARFLKQIYKGGFAQKPRLAQKPAWADTDASAVTGIRIGACAVQGFESADAITSPQFAVHVQGDALLAVAFGPDSIDGLLRLAVAPVAPLHRVARRTQQPVVQEAQRLLQRRTAQLPQRPPQALEPPQPPPQLLQPPQRRLRLAAPVEQPIHLVHDRAQRPQLRLAERLFLQHLLLSRAEGVLDEPMTVLEQLRHAPLQPLDPPPRGLVRLPWPAAFVLGDLRLPLLAEFRQERKAQIPKYKF